MKKVLLMSFVLTLSSCATMTETIPGYTVSDLAQKKAELQNADRNQIVKVLGIPASEGLCYGGGRVDVGRPVYTMVYLEKSVPRYEYALDVTNEKRPLKCTFLSLYENEEGQFVWRGNVMPQTMCNGQYGRIKSVEDSSKCKKVYTK